MVRLAALCVLGLIGVLPGTAQEVRTRPEARMLKRDVSPPMRPPGRDVSPPMRLLGTPPLDLPREVEPPRDLPRPSTGSQLDPVIQSSAAASAAAVPGLNIGGLGAGFVGPQGAFAGGTPADATVAVGTTQIVQWVNFSYAVFDKATGRVLQGPIAGNGLWKGFGAPCETYNSGDIVAQYDKAAHRWVMAQPVFSAPFAYCLAVSTTDDATGSFYRYALALGDGFPDYPKLAVWTDAYYVTMNISSGGALGTEAGARVCAFDRSAILQGGNAAVQCFDPGAEYTFLLPADLDGPAPPPGAPEYLMQLANGINGLAGLNLWKFHVDFANPADSALTGPIQVAGWASSQSCSGPVPQPGTTQGLGCNGDILMYRLAYRNFGDHESLVTTHSAVAGAGLGVRWYEIRNPATSPSVYQQGTYAPDSNFRWMSSGGMDREGNIAVAYNVSSSTTYPSIRYAGRSAGDPLNTMQVESSMAEGGKTQGSFRWGDYSSLVIDPVDDCTFWYTAEYMQAGSDSGWSTRIASFQFPSCSSTPDFSVSVSPVHASTLATYHVRVAALNGFAGTVSLSVAGLRAGGEASFNPPTIAVPGSSTLTVRGRAALSHMTIIAASGAVARSAALPPASATSSGDLTLLQPQRRRDLTEKH